MAAEKEKEKKAAPADEKAAEGQEPKKKRFGLKTILLVGGWAVLQLAIIGGALWILKTAKEAPAKAEAAQSTEAAGNVEMSVIPSDADGKLKAVNAKSGRLVYWTLKVHLQVPEEQAEHVKKKLAANENFVKQEIATIISACDPVLLEQEADHATLKRQIRFALNKVVGNGAINEVLISECIPATMD